jgi:hypothetical protein
MDDLHTLLDAALTYAEQYGWPLFPPLPGPKKPLKDSHGYIDAPTDLDKIRAWWEKTPMANIVSGFHTWNHCNV